MEKEKEDAGTEGNFAASLDHTRDKAKRTLQIVNMKPKIPSGTRLVNKQVGMIRTMEKESRKAKAVKERTLEKAFRPLATKALKSDLSRPPEKESQGRAKEKAKVKTAARQAAAAAKGAGAGGGGGGGGVPPPPKPSGFSRAELKG